ncbi:hypothetical protein ABT324_12155 [Saccharopolyspora sp. NPDC000359]|uniref:hypothetical protein n=1 Tax=Saccharopolyspora sp. NPDC000359 TaxID=3154251 RepID=UPI00331B518D
MTRARGLRLLLAAGAAVVLGGCGVQPSGIIHGVAPPSGVADPATTTTLYLVSGGRLAAVTRPVGPMSRAEALELLARGPTGEERARGLTSAVPPSAGPFSVTTDVSGRTAITSTAAPGELSALAVDQIVCTAAADGGQVVLLGGGGDREPLICSLRR